MDNKNLASEHTSEDLRVVRWNHNIRESGCVMRYWVPGEWNTIADYASRAVVADADGILNAEEQFELHIYALALGGGEGVGSGVGAADARACLLYTSPSPRDRTRSRMPSSA